LKSVDGRLKAWLSPPEIPLLRPILAKGEPASWAVFLQGESYNLTLDLADVSPDTPVYLSIKANRQAVWDDLTSASPVRLVFAASPGENTIEIVSLNRPVRISRIVLNLESADNK
jgi:hypothetical protein